MDAALSTLTADYILQRRLLADAERQFKLALSVRNLCNGSSNAFDYLDAFSFGHHLAEHDELRLTAKEEDRAAAALEHSTTYLMAIQLDTALALAVPQRFKHPDVDIQSACWIARLLRNAFAHNPLNPTWPVYQECADQTFAVRDIVTLTTTSLNGRRVDWMDYGGPLALLRLCAFVRREVLGARQ